MNSKDECVRIVRMKALHEKGRKSARTMLDTLHALEAHGVLEKAEIDYGALWNIRSAMAWQYLPQHTRDAYIREVNAVLCRNGKPDVGSSAEMQSGPGTTMQTSDLPTSQAIRQALDEDAPLPASVGLILEAYADERVIDVRDIKPIQTDVWCLDCGVVADLGGKAGACDVLGHETLDVLVVQRTAATKHIGMFDEQPTSDGQPTK